MRTAHVTEITRRPQPVDHDTFLDGLRDVVVRPGPRGAGASAARRPGGPRGDRARRGVPARA